MDPKEAQRIKEEMAAKGIEPGTYSPSMETQETPEWLKTLTVAEVLEMPEFDEALKIIMRKARNTRDEVLSKYDKLQIKADPIRYLENMHEWNTLYVKNIYVGCLTKSLDTSCYNAKIRSLVEQLGHAAIHETIEILKRKEIKNEKSV